MKKIICSVTMAWLFCCFFSGLSMAEEYGLLETKQGVNAHNVPYIAYFYGIKSEIEPQIKKYHSDILPGGYVEGGYIPDEYLIKNVEVEHVYPNSKTEKNPFETGYFFYFGETYGLLANAIYDENGKWKGQIVKKIKIVFLNKATN